MESSAGPTQKSVCLEALAVALQHQAVASQQRSICSLLQVSKAWRSAVQRSAAGLTDVNFSKEVTMNNLNNLSSLTRWLTKHPGLISTLSIHPCYVSPADCAAVAEVVQDLIGFGLQAAAASAAASGPDVAGQGPTKLQLRSYSTSVAPSAGLLASLPAATLTNLVLKKVDNSCCWYDALSQLTSLGSLSLTMSHIPTDYEQSVTNNCLSRIGHLQQLTHLKLHNVAVVGNMQLLPTQLQALDLDYKQQVSSPVVDLQHLASLQRLQLVAKPLEAASAFPNSLQALAIDAYWPAQELSSLSSLHKMTSVQLKGDGISSLHLSPLSQLNSLKHLSLSLSPRMGLEDLLEAAGIWHKLPLRSLHINSAIDTTHDTVQRLMQHVAAATKLTELDVRICFIFEDEGAPELAVCEHLTALRELQKLSLSIGEPENFVQQDAQHLSALTSLTSLELCKEGRGPYMDTTILCLLAVTLTGLKRLSINHSENHTRPGQSQWKVGCLPALPVIGRLTGLESLHLEKLSATDARRGLQLMTGLVNLMSLKGFSEAGWEALRAFEDNWKAQRQRLRLAGVKLS